MTEYDIVQIEDNLNQRKHLRECLDKRGLTYLGLSCLQALEETLPTTSGSIWVVDGNFPRQDGEQILKLAYEAFDKIRRAYPESKIVFFSFDESLARGTESLKSEYRNKINFTAERFANELEEMLSEGQD